MEKNCSKCKNEKDIILFSKDSGRKDGLDSICKECRNTFKKEYDIKNKEILYIKRKIYDQIPKVKDYNRKKSLEYYHRTKKVPLLKLKRNLRQRINQSLKAKKWNRLGPSETLLGCTYEEFLIHFELLFKEGMTWDNHGVHGWHIDHIKPLDKAETENELIELCHYTNLQPLWAEDNLRKNKY